MEIIYTVVPPLMKKLCWLSLLTLWGQITIDAKYPDEMKDIHGSRKTMQIDMTQQLEIQHSRYGHYYSF